MAAGLIAVIIAKIKCFCWNVDEEGCQAGIAFSDKAIIPEKEGRFETIPLDSDILIVKRYADG